MLASVVVVKYYLVVVAISSIIHSNKQEVWVALLKFTDLTFGKLLANCKYYFVAGKE